METTLSILKDLIREEMSQVYAFEDPDLESFRKEVVRELSDARWLKEICEKTLGRECNSVALVGSVLDPKSFHNSSDVDVAFSLKPLPGEKVGLSENLSYKLQLELVKTPVVSSVLNSLVFVGPIKTKKGKTLSIFKDLIREELGRNIQSPPAIDVMQNWKNIDGIHAEITPHPSLGGWYAKISTETHSLPIRFFSDETSANFWAREQVMKIQRKIMSKVK